MSASDLDLMNITYVFVARNYIMYWEWREDSVIER